MIPQILAVVAPVALIVAAGAVWARLGYAYDTDLVTNLVFYLGAPALVFTTLSAFEVDAGTGRFALASVVALASFGLIGAAALYVLRLPVRQLAVPVMFPNLGNMGLPLCLFAFGQAGLALGVVFFAIGTTLHYTVGVWMLSDRLGVVEMLRTPLLYATAAGLAVQALGITPWTWITNSTELLGNFTIPLLLLTLGVALARIRVRNIARGSAVAALRLTIGLGVGVGLSAVLGLQGTERGVLILNSMMPTAVFSYLLALKYKAFAEDVAGAVTLSTVGAFLMLPVVLVFLL